MANGWPSIGSTNKVPKMSNAEKRKLELKEQLRLLRGEISGNLENIGNRLNVVQRLQSAVIRNQKKWLIGALVIGGVLAFSSARHRTSGNSPDSGSKGSWFFDLLGKTGKQIVQMSAPSLAKILCRGVEHWTLPGADASTAVGQHPARRTENC